MDQDEVIQVNAMGRGDIHLDVDASDDDDASFHVNYWIDMATLDLDNEPDAERSRPSLKRSESGTIRLVGTTNQLNQKAKAGLPPKPYKQFEDNSKEVQTLDKAWPIRQESNATPDCYKGMPKINKEWK
jgi:hypothetical protein